VPPKVLFCVDDLTPNLAATFNIWVFDNSPTGLGMLETIAAKSWMWGATVFLAAGMNGSTAVNLEALVAAFNKRKNI
jgi:hypothetical protein